MKNHTAEKITYLIILPGNLSRPAERPQNPVYEELIWRILPNTCSDHGLLLSFYILKKSLCWVLLRWRPVVENNFTSCEITQVHTQSKWIFSRDRRPVKCHNSLYWLISILMKKRVLQKGHHYTDRQAISVYVCYILYVNSHARHGDVKTRSHQNDQQNIF